MFQILEILRKNRFSVLFIVLQLIAFGLLFNQNTFHRISFLNTTGFIAGSTYSAKNSVFNYFNLKEINTELHQENSQLRNELEYLKSKLEEDFYCNASYDSLARSFNGRFSIKTAKIIHLSKKGKDFFLTINKGSKDGVQKEMGVIGTQGIVGKILYVSTNYSILMSINNSKFFTNVKVKDAVGSLYWDGKEEDICQINSITKHKQIEIGDSVFTSNLSTIFPEDILLGTVSAIDITANEEFLNINVKMNNKVKEIKNVHYVEDDYLQYKTVLQDSLNGIY